jgi:carbon storage regulator
MLVIRRRAGESLLIGDQAEIEILEIEGSQVKLGIRAPRHVSVLRKEIQLTIAQNRAALQIEGDTLLRLAERLRLKPSE